MAVIEVQCARLRDLASSLRTRADTTSFLRHREAESWRRYADMLDEISHALTEAAANDEVKSVRRIAGLAGAAVLMLSTGLVTGGAEGAGQAAYNALISGCDVEQSAPQFVDENLSLQLELARLDEDTIPVPSVGTLPEALSEARIIVEAAIREAGLDREVAGATLGVTEVAAASEGEDNPDDLAGSTLVISYQAVDGGSWARLPTSC
jgi:hypothetical protein